MFKRSELTSKGYTLRYVVDYKSTDTDIEGFIEEYKDLSVDDPNVEDLKKRFVLIIETNEDYDQQYLENGEWKLFVDHNDIGWCVISLGFFTYSPNKEIKRCEVVTEDGTETALYLMEIDDKGELSYLDANNDMFSGKVKKAELLV